MLKVRKYWHHLLYADVICFFVITKCQKIIKNRWKLTKIANIDRECLHIFRTTWKISIKFSGNMWFAIISKVTKKQSFALALQDTFLQIPQGWVKLTYFESTFESFTFLLFIKCKIFLNNIDYLIKIFNFWNLFFINSIS